MEKILTIIDLVLNVLTLGLWGRWQGAQSSGVKLVAYGNRVRYFDTDEED